jgi:hypothetical protein
MYSFERRKKSTQVQSHIRRLLDLTVPNLPKGPKLSRSEDRGTRVLPALLCPCEKNRPVVEDCTYVLTRDFASEGVGVLLTQPFRAVDVFITFWLDAVMDEPWYFLGSCHGLRRFGGGYWALGIRLSQLVEHDRKNTLRPLLPLVDQLRAPEAVLKQVAATER